MQYFNWDKQRLIERSLGNLIPTLIKAGIQLPENWSGTSSPSPDEPWECRVCSDSSPIEAAALRCNHKFCKSCWSRYIANKIRTGAEHRVICMEEGCPIVAPNDFIDSLLVNDRESLERFKQSLVRHFVSCDPKLKFCPYPSCTNAVSCPAVASHSVPPAVIPIVGCDPSGTHRFCFGCPIDTDHRPVPCAIANLWLQQCQNSIKASSNNNTSRVSEDWIPSYIRRCGRCQSPIERNGGCK